MVKGAWVTLATNDSYSLGALVLAHSLKQVGTQKELAVLITPGVTNSMRSRLSEVFNSVKEVNILDSKDKANLKLLQRPELGITFTKLHCWQLTEYEKCVFLDADTLVLQNCDELFEREELSAAPDVGWPDCFNSGVFVYRPSEETYSSLVQFALDKGSFDGGDQGLLNLYFSDWAQKDISKHLPFIYNVCSTAFYSYLPAFKQFGKDIKIIHFIGNAKPWLQYFDTESKTVRPSRDLGHLEPILQMWWNIFCSMIHPNLSTDMSGLAGAFARLTLGQQRTPEQEELENCLRRQNWEQGNIDYLGRDSFDNIWSKICQTLAKGPQEDEGGDATQIKTDDLLLESPQQEVPKEDVLSRQEVSQPTESSTDITAQKIASTDLSPSCPPTNESSDNSVEKAPSTPAQVTTPVNVPSSTEEISASTTEQVPSEKEPTKDISSKTEEQALSPNVPAAKETSTVEEVPSGNKSSTEEPPKPESETKVSVEETSKSSIVAQTSTEEISKVSTVPSESTPPSTEEISAPLRSPNLPEVTAPMSVTLASKDVPSTPVQIGQEECVSCPIASAPVPTKPEVPKQDITTENILPEPQIISSPPTQEAQQLTKQVDSKQEVTPEATSCKRTPPTTPSTESPLCTPVQIPPPETPAKEENLIDPAAQALPSPPEQPVQKETPVVEASQSIPLTEKILEKTPSLTEASAPTECSKPEETPAHIEETPAEGKTCSLEKAPAPTAQGASAPLVPPEKPSAPSEPTSTISLASDEPPPPIAPPPRKSGGKKNQSKPKK